MARLGLMFTLVLLHPVRGELIQTILGDSMKFAPTGSCVTDAGGRLQRRLLDEQPRRVADLVDGLWRPSGGYEDRLSPGRYVVLEPVVFNDAGLYELRCNGSASDVLIQVEALVAVQVSAVAGEPVTLRCHFLTAGTGVESVRWETNAGLVVEQHLASSGKTYGDGFEGRASISRDALARGDLSLTVERVRLRDRGDYFCKASVEKGLQRGNPAAVRMTVTEKPVRKTSSTPTHATTSEGGRESPQCPHWSWTTFLETVGICVTIGFLGFLGWNLKNNKGICDGCTYHVPEDVQERKHFRFATVTAKQTIVKLGGKTEEDGKSKNDEQQMTNECDV